ncbi:MULTISPECIES: hypothetical protein [Rhodococcus]|uniref:hypothetical protein n=1 Tax=Rhodococcus TaxID=1827 RepID=UPI0023E31F3F|nr:hypothetical protein [Rhodococcus sp. T2V]MDF3312613.1 hypothetical protein [Rhodococcus sp. T2V]
MPRIEDPDNDHGPDVGFDDDPIRWPDPSPLDLWWQRVMSESLRRSREPLTQPVPPMSAGSRHRGLRPHAS